MNIEKIRDIQECLWLCSGMSGINCSKCSYREECIEKEGGGAAHLCVDAYSAIDYLLKTAEGENK